MKEFKIYPKDSPHFFIARLFQAKVDMQEAAAKYQELIGIEKKHIEKDGFLSIVFPHEGYIINSDGTECAPTPNIGVVYFNSEHLNAEVIAHESTHCAMHFERVVNNNKNAEFGDGNNEVEERLAYLVGQFTSLFYKTLKDAI